jgi:hypothetical protein
MKTRMKTSETMKNELFMPTVQHSTFRHQLFSEMANWVSYNEYAFKFS